VKEKKSLLRMIGKELKKLKNLPKRLREESTKQRSRGKSKRRR